MMMMMMMMMMMIIIIIIKTEHHAYTEMQLECIPNGVSNMHAMQCC